jgi:hypothetical protein
MTLSLPTIAVKVRFDFDKNCWYLTADNTAVTIDGQAYFPVMAELRHLLAQKGLQMVGRTIIPT